MKYLNFTKQLAAVAVVASLFTACDKAKTADPIGDRGQTVVKIIGGGNPSAIVKKPVDFVPTPTTLKVVDLRRDIPNNTELNRVMHVTILDDTAAVTAASPNYIHLDPSWYTIDASTPKTGGEGGVFNLTLAPGEFAKPIYITITDATVLDPSALYGLGFTITTTDADGVISDSRSVVVEIGAKNNWDGVYLMTGTFVDVTNAGFTYFGDQQYSLITASGTTCNVLNDDLNGGVYGYIFENAGNGTYYGAYGLVIGFNPATNAIADLHNYYGDPTNPPSGGQSTAAGSGPPNYSAGNGRRAVLDPSGVNAVQGNKDIVIKHWMLHPSVVPLPNPRAKFDETWVYQGPR